MASPFYGGPIFRPVGEIGDEKGRTKQNNLRMDIAKVEVDIVNGGGYY